MKSRNVFKLAALMLGAVFIVLFIKFGLREEPISKKKPRPQAKIIKLTKDETPSEPKKKVSVLKKTRRKKKQVDSSPSEFDEMYARFVALKPMLLNEDKKCIESIEKIIPGEDFIDNADEMYKNPENIIKNISVIANLLYRPMALKAYQTAEELAFMREFEDSNIDIMEFYSNLANINTCRDPKVLNYLITALEAANKFKWSDKQKKNLASMVMKSVFQDLNQMPTALNLSFNMHVLNSMLELGYISDSYRDEIQFLVNDVMEHQVSIMERLQPGQDRRKKLQELLFDFEVRKNAAGKLMDLMNKYTREL